MISDEIRLSKWPASSRQWEIIEECVPIMLKAFGNGTEFAVSNDEWERGQMTGLKFEGKHYFDVNDKLNHIKVTNDERRRLLPILLRQLQLQSLSMLDGRPYRKSRDSCSRPAYLKASFF